jgi:hypothetical protein
MRIINQIIHFLKILKIVLDDLRAGVKPVEIPQIIKKVGRLFRKVSPDELRFNSTSETK